MSQVKKKRTLLFSTDPQASLSDIFERNFYGLGEIEGGPAMAELVVVKGGAALEESSAHINVGSVVMFL